MVTLVNRAKVSTSTTGTGTVTLGAAEDGYQTFAAAGVADGDVVRYVIEDGTSWEIGTGTYTATGTTLSRTPSESSNADAAINLSGSAVVYVSATAADIPSLQLYAENPSSPTAPSATGTNAVAIGSGTVASQNGNIALGQQANASGNSRAAAIGYLATASANYTISAGPFSDATGAGSAAFGYLSQAISGEGATALTKSYASGSYSFAAAIANNTSSYGATGANSVAIGKLTRATSTESLAMGASSVASSANAIAVGNTNTASGASGATVVGGYSNTASGTKSFVFGAVSTASADNAMVLGERGVADTIGKLARASGGFSAVAGTAQSGTFVLRSDTTDATPEALTTNNSTAGNTNQIILPNNSAYAFHGTIVARQDAASGTACAAWKIEGLIRREGSAGTTVLVNSATTVIDNTPSWGMALSADTTNGGLKIEVTGAAATNIRWVCTCHTSEVSY